MYHCLDIKKATPKGKNKTVSYRFSVAEESVVTDFLGKKVKKQQ